MFLWRNSILRPTSTTVAWWLRRQCFILLHPPPEANTPWEIRNFAYRLTPVCPFKIGWYVLAGYCPWVVSILANPRRRTRYSSKVQQSQSRCHGSAPSGLDHGVYTAKICYKKMASQNLSIFENTGFLLLLYILLTKIYRRIPNNYFFIRNSYLDEIIIKFFNVLI